MFFISHCWHHMHNGLGLTGPFLLMLIQERCESPKTQAVARAGEKTRGLRPRNSPRGGSPLEHKIVITQTSAQQLNCLNRLKPTLWTAQGTLRVQSRLKMKPTLERKPKQRDDHIIHVVECTRDATRKNRNRSNDTAT